MSAALSGVAPLVSATIIRETLEKDCGTRSLLR
jgi:hypothetical protein